MIWLRLKTRSGSPASSASSLNSDGVSGVVVPSTTISCRAKSIRNPPICCTAAPVAARSSSRRRSSARTRLFSSAIENGFVT